MSELNDDFDKTKETMEAETTIESLDISVAAYPNNETFQAEKYHSEENGNDVGVYTSSDLTNSNVCSTVDDQIMIDLMVSDDNVESTPNSPASARISIQTTDDTVIIRELNDDFDKTKETMEAETTIKSLDISEITKCPDNVTFEAEKFNSKQNENDVVGVCTTSDLTNSNVSPADQPIFIDLTVSDDEVDTVPNSPVFAETSVQTTEFDAIITNKLDAYNSDNSVVCIDIDTDDKIKETDGSDNSDNNVVEIVISADEEIKETDGSDSTHEKNEKYLFEQFF